jgi:hypothetical protein
MKAYITGTCGWCYNQQGKWMEEGFMSKKQQIGIPLLFSLLIVCGLVASCYMTFLHVVKATPHGNAIQRENAQQGTTAWMIPTGQGATTQMQIL